MKRPLVPYDGDMLSDIGDTPFSEFWERCEDLLPEDWALTLLAWPHRGFLVYAAKAFLQEDEDVAKVVAGWCSTPNRAIEGLFYKMRDGIVSTDLVMPTVPPPPAGDERHVHRGQERRPDGGEN